jgi:hypothetical protein
MLMSCALILKSAAIPYYVIGGIAAIAHGEPRATIDLDVVISIDLPQLPALVAELENQGFYVASLPDVMAGRLRCLNLIHIALTITIVLTLPGLNLRQFCLNSFRHLSGRSPRGFYKAKSKRPY